MRGGKCAGQVETHLRKVGRCTCYSTCDRVLLGDLVNNHGKSHQPRWNTDCAYRATGTNIKCFPGLRYNMPFCGRSKAAHEKTRGSSYTTILLRCFPMSVISAKRSVSVSRRIESLEGALKKNDPNKRGIVRQRRSQTGLTK